MDTYMKIVYASDSSEWAFARSSFYDTFSSVKPCSCCQSTKQRDSVLLHGNFLNIDCRLYFMWHIYGCAGKHYNNNNKNNKKSLRNCSMRDGRLFMQSIRSFFIAESGTIAYRAKQQQQIELNYFTGKCIAFEWIVHRCSTISMNTSEQLRWTEMCKCVTTNSTCHNESKEQQHFPFKHL